MALTLTGINTGVIRRGNQFQARALEDAQIALIIRAISHAINNAGTGLPLYRQQWARLRMRHYREIPHSGKDERDRDNGPTFTGIQPASEKAGRETLPYHRSDDRIRRGSLSSGTLPTMAE